MDAKVACLCMGHIQMQNGFCTILMILLPLLHLLFLLVHFSNARNANHRCHVKLVCQLTIQNAILLLAMCLILHSYLKIIAVRIYVSIYYFKKANHPTISHCFYKDLITSLCVGCDDCNHLFLFILFFRLSSR